MTKVTIIRRRPSVIIHSYFSNATSESVVTCNFFSIASRANLLQRKIAESFEQLHHIRKRTIRSLCLKFIKVAFYFVKSRSHTCYLSKNTKNTNISQAAAIKLIIRVNFHIYKTLPHMCSNSQFKI